MNVADTPHWRQGYDAVERQLAPRLEEVVRSEQFAVVVGLASRVQHTLEERATQTSRRVLHQLNLPAGTDVARILNELGALRREVHELQHDLAATRAELLALQDGEPTVARIAPAKSARTRRAPARPKAGR